MEFTRIETLAGVKRTIYNQYDSLMAPLQKWLADQGVQMPTGCHVTEVGHEMDAGLFTVTSLTFEKEGKCGVIPIGSWDLLPMTNH